MVDVSGHVGMALLFLAPSWILFRHTRTAAAFVLVSVPFGLLPDVDLYLSAVDGIHHHGIFHTVLVVSLFAVVLGPLVGRVFETVLEETGDLDRPVAQHGALLGVAGVWTAGISHLFADMLSAPDVSQAIEPLWPVYDGQLVAIDVLWYKSIWATVGLLALGIAVNLGLWRWKQRGGESHTASRNSSR